MVSISVCMIVKNEEKVLARCLDSLQGLYDELVIVDTGSTDRTKEISEKYTDQIYDFQWTGSFSDARNFAFSKCTKDYIYSADADEVLDEADRTKFAQLKQALLTDIEIVQMIYDEPGGSDVLNSRKELRPKLYKRIRSFIWEGPVHETVRLEPLVYDSDIVITHLPDKKKDHHERDLAIFEQAYKKEGRLSHKLYGMYIRELFKNGSKQAVQNACEIFSNVLVKEQIDDDLYLDICCLMLRSARMSGNTTAMLKYSSNILSVKACAEACYEMGLFFLDTGDLDEACSWFQNAMDSECRIDIHCGGDLPLTGLAEVYNRLYQKTGNSADHDTSEKYKKQAADWQLPEEL